MRRFGHRPYTGPAAAAAPAGTIFILPTLKTSARYRSSAMCAAAAAMWKTGGRSCLPAGHPHALRLTCKWENRSRRTPIEWAAGSGFVFLLWFSGGALRGPCGSIRGLPVICARAVLSQEVLVLHILGRRSRARVDLNRQKRHFRHFLQHRGMIYSLRLRLCPMRKAHGCGR